MPIAKIDAHHHLWRRDSPNHPMLSAPPTERFFGNTAGLQVDFAPERFRALADPQNVVGSVYVESHYHPVAEECAAIQRIADDHGFPQAIVGTVDPAGADLAARLDRDLAVPRFRGVRVMVNHDPDPMFAAVARDGLLRDADWRRGYAAIGERGVSVEVMALPHQLDDLAALAAAVPGTPLIVGHAGMPARRSAAEDATWHQGMAALARVPHVVVKISGLAMVDHRWTVASITPVVLAVIDRFGPERCMFGSNFPVDALHGTYDQVWDGFDAATAGLAEAARDAVFRDTARRVYRID